MRGTLIKEKLKTGRTSWGYYFLAGKDEGGKRRQVTKQGFTTKKEAEQALRLAIENKAPGSVVLDGRSQTLAELFDYWLEHHADRRCAPKTLERYRQLGAYAIQLIGTTKLAALEPLPIEQAINALKDHGGQKSKAFPNGRPLAAKTVRHIGFLLSDVCKTAVRWGLLSTNPMDRVELPKAEKRDVTVLDEGKIALLFAAAENTRLYAFLVTASATGARRGELLALQWVDLDLETRMMSVTKSLEETLAGLRVKSTKSGKPRRFSLPEFAVSVLREHKEVQERERELYGATYSNGNLVFCKPDGSFYRPDSISCRVTELARKCGLPKGVSLHVLRHSHASQLLSSGAPLPVVAKRLGHASPNVTLAIYSHALEADELAAAKIWNDAMTTVIAKDRDQSLEKSRRKQTKGI